MKNIPSITSYPVAIIAIKASKQVFYNFAIVLIKLKITRPNIDTPDLINLIRALGGDDLP